MGHHCCSKHKVKRGLWSPEEDEKLFNYITVHGHACWSTVPREAGLQRCGKSCRLRWMNYLKPDLKRGSFSVEEERVIIDVHRILGNRWAQIAKHLPGRTDNEVKNFWNSCIKKKLIAQGLDPKTHNLMPASRLSAAAAGNNSDELFQSSTTTTVPFTISSLNRGFDRAKGFDKMAIPPALMAPPQSNVALHESTVPAAALSDLHCQDSHVLMSFANASSSSPSLGPMNYAAASSSSFINDQTGNFMDDCVWDGGDMEQHFESLNHIEVVGDDEVVQRKDEVVQVQTCTLGNEKQGLMMEAYCGFDLEMMDSSLLPCGDFYSGGGGGGGSMEQLQWHC
ncbi:transcription factor MYB86-like [Zingiber officinale]|uniref:Uncharacterized protein n=1 Tax=Zingiber officinale TaxID=94328 RepID=A0A8J5FIP0_ZINOF|nr:transcription factor MYB86-like [Zingiber officinale]KAG6486548.1 hypothetical protein ZIOFF_055125 [Zingiber officinale]